MRHYIALGRNTHFANQKIKTQLFPCENARNSSHIHRSKLRRCEIRKKKSQYKGMLYLRTNIKLILKNFQHRSYTCRTFWGDSEGTQKQ